MEDILASIKRVIADEKGPIPASARPARRSPRAEAAPSSPPAGPEDDVLELKDPVSEQDGLLSADAAAASRQKLAALSALRDKVDGPLDASPLEAVVREMLRPVLKDWLDQHLPEIVEDLVTREIARITGSSV